MDMSELNKEILAADDSLSMDGPRFPDGVYLLAVTEHEEKHGDYQQNADGSWPQLGFWVTFKICEGPYKGKDHKQYFGLKHPTSPISVKYGLADLKKLYKAVNFVPQQFSDIYGKRFTATLESKKQDNDMYPWSTKITHFDPAPPVQGQTFNETVNQTHATPQDVAQQFNGQEQQVNPRTGPTSFPTNNQNDDEIPF